jgi:hypothetical protein
MRFALSIGAVGLIGAALLALAPAAGAQVISGFGNGSNFTLNNAGASDPATINAGTLEITDGSGNDWNSAYYTNKVNVGAFTASFEYQEIGVTDGFTFIVQDGSVNAVSDNDGGSGLGWNGLPDSAAVEFDTFRGNLTGYETEGVDNVGNGNGGEPVSPVNFASGDEILVSLQYTGTTLFESLTDLSNSDKFLTSYSGVNIPSAVGSDKAWVGFTAGSGGASAVQKISNFSFTSAPEPGSVALAASACVPLVPALRRRRRMAR